MYRSHGRIMHQTPLTNPITSHAKLTSTPYLYTRSCNSKSNAHKCDGRPTFAYTRPTNYDMNKDVTKMQMLLLNPLDKQFLNTHNLEPHIFSKQNKFPKSCKLISTASSASTDLVNQSPDINYLQMQQLKLNNCPLEMIHL